MQNPAKTGTLEPVDAICQQDGHLWGDPYSFGGAVWHRDCFRCYETQPVGKRAREGHLQLVDDPDCSRATG